MNLAPIAAVDFPQRSVRCAARAQQSIDAIIVRRRRDFSVDCLVLALEIVALGERLDRADDLSDLGADLAMDKAGVVAQGLGLDFEGGGAGDELVVFLLQRKDALVSAGEPFALFHIRKGDVWPDYDEPLPFRWVASDSDPPATRRRRHSQGFERVLRQFVFMAHAADRVPKGLHVVVAVDHLQGAVLARLGQILEHRAGGGQRSEGVAETQIRNALRFYRL